MRKDYPTDRRHVLSRTYSRSPGCRPSTRGPARRGPRRRSSTCSSTSAPRTRPCTAPSACRRCSTARSIVDARGRDRLPAPQLREDVRDAHLLADHPVHRPAQLLLVVHQQPRLRPGGGEAPGDRGAAAGRGDPRDPLGVHPHHGPPRLHRHEPGGPGRAHQLLVLRSRRARRSTTCSRPAAARGSTVTYVRIGGLAQDVPDGLRRARAQGRGRGIPEFVDYVDQLVTKNIIFQQRTRGVGVVDRENALSWGWVGPCLPRLGRRLRRPQGPPLLRLRALRLRRPGAHRRRQFSTATWCAWRRCAQSLRIIEQAPRAAARGPGHHEGPPRRPAAEERGLLEHRSADEPLQAHLHGITPPAGEVYGYTEAPNGELGFYIVTDGRASRTALHVARPASTSSRPTTRSCAARWCPTPWPSSAGSTSSPESSTGSAVAAQGDTLATGNPGDPDRRRPHGVRAAGTNVLEAAS